MYHPETIITFPSDNKRTAFINMLKGFHNNSSFNRDIQGLHLSMEFNFIKQLPGPFTAGRSIYLYTSIKNMKNGKYLLELPNVSNQDVKDYMKWKAWIY
jgi:hypothetical protein